MTNLSCVASPSLCLIPLFVSTLGSLFVFKPVYMKSKIRTSLMLNDLRKHPIANSKGSFQDPETSRNQFNARERARKTYHHSTLLKFAFDDVRHRVGRPVTQPPSFPNPAQNPPGISEISTHSTWLQLDIRFMLIAVVNIRATPKTPSSPPPEARQPWNVRSRRSRSPNPGIPRSRCELSAGRAGAGLECQCAVGRCNFPWTCSWWKKLRRGLIRSMYL